MLELPVDGQAEHRQPAGVDRHGQATDVVWPVGELDRPAADLLSRAGGAEPDGGPDQGTVAQTKGRGPRPRDGGANRSAMCCRVAGGNASAAPAPPPRSQLGSLQSARGWPAGTGYAASQRTSAILARPREAVRHLRVHAAGKEAAARGGGCAAFAPRPEAQSDAQLLKPSWSARAEPSHSPAPACRRCGPSRRPQV